jgi:hypothetical protein
MNCNSELWCNSCHEVEVKKLAAMELSTSAWEVLIKQVSTAGLHVRCTGGHS